MDLGFQEYYLGLSCLKYIVLGFNSLFMMSGILLVSIGIAVLNFYYFFDAFLETSFFSPSTLLLVTGGFIFLIAMIGFLSVIKESTLLINTYCILLGFVCLLQVSAAIAAIAMKDKVGSTLSTKMYISIHKYAYDRNASKAVDFMQTSLQCCGVNGPLDWKDVIFETKNNLFEDTDIILPKSCCSHFVNATCIRTYRTGCLHGMNILIFQIAKILVGSCLTLTILQLTGMFFTHSLAKILIHIKSQRLAQQIVLQNQMQTIYDIMGTNINAATQMQRDKPPPYEEVTKSHR